MKTAEQKTKEYTDSVHPVLQLEEDYDLDDDCDDDDLLDCCPNAGGITMKLEPIFNTAKHVGGMQKIKNGINR